MPLLNKLSLACVLCIAAAAAAHAEEPAGTLQKIKASGVIAVGYRPASVPFSMRDRAGTPAGYTLDLCARIIDNVRKELGLADIKVRHVEVKSSDRIQKLLDGEIDLECGSTTNTRERSAQVTFANTIFVTSSRILTLAASPIKGIDGLKGQRVAIAQGASVAPLLSKIDVEKGLNIQYVRVKDFAEGFQALEAGRVAAFVSDDIQFAQYIARSTRPQDYAVVGEPISVDPLGIMMRRQDARLHAIANQTLAGLAASGEFERIYAKWFVTPTLKFPMGETLRKLLKAPNNQANY
ncbi:amino acid ABC transporter substrate-binding protein [Pseudoduganella namucuonensis]|uniref:Amino acid ABC transporter substrate-binding protein, PAAT family n=1 Tax=Pseudoduganella namucuonensis TaxID=1035707 RepID=A0A1I7F428_9BURK|nr:amino acid ABC transporter substrate-binding protein [Pseudoduganella namucuonensis]SFU30927.1 amino acid ABC transporter substrate-binding protein, PAAT family [Pseudoduganella namucuonensis]